MKLQPNKNPRREGFTLVELLLVMMIIATLAAIVIPRVAGRAEQAKITAAGQQIANIEEALDHFEVDTGSYPKSGALNLLIEQPSDAPGWRGPYLKKGIPLDPWGNPYTYEYPGKHNTAGYDVFCNGPDGKAGTDDDINNWDVNKK